MRVLHCAWGSGWTRVVVCVHACVVSAAEKVGSTHPDTARTFSACSVEWAARLGDNKERT